MKAWVRGYHLMACTIIISLSCVSVVVRLYASCVFCPCLIMHEGVYVYMRMNERTNAQRYRCANAQKAQMCPCAKTWYDIICDNALQCIIANCNVGTTRYKCGMISMVIVRHNIHVSRSWALSLFKEHLFHSQNHYSQLASHEGRCSIQVCTHPVMGHHGLSWAITGYFWLLTVIYGVSIQVSMAYHWFICPNQLDRIFERAPAEGGPSNCPTTTYLQRPSWPSPLDPLTRACIHTFIHSYIHTYIPLHIHTYLPTYHYTYIPTNLPAYLPTYLHTYLHTSRRQGRRTARLRGRSAADVRRAL